MLTLLFSSAGRRVELMNCFRNAAGNISTEIRIIAIDTDPDWSPGCYTADHFFKVPRCTAQDFVPAVADICRQFGVNLIIPTIDTELNVYAEERETFHTVGTEILLSDKSAIVVARDKKKTADLLRAHDIHTPKTWPAIQLRSSEEDIPYPVFLKPVDGSRSQGIFTAKTFNDILAADIDLSRYIAQEICQGAEYTINAFYNRHGVCRACVPHYRKYVRSGEVCLAETVRVPAFTAVAHKFSDIFSGLWGNICFQGFLDQNGSVSITEINARFGGGYPICDEAGGTYAKWILQDLMGQQPDYNDDWQEGLRMLRYDAAVFTKANQV